MPSKIPTHRPDVPRVNRHRDYDRFARNPEAKAFYDSPGWQAFRRWKLATSPLCEFCLGVDRLTSATLVHHKTPLRDDWSQALDPANAKSACDPCHSRHHRKSPSR